MVAVDPGTLHLPAAVLASRRVEHLAMRIEQALPLLLVRQTVAAGAAAEGPFELLVCDMNDTPARVVGVLMLALPLLAPGAFFALTFKNGFASKRAWREALCSGLDELRGFAENVRELHLLANTARETSVVGRLRRVESPANGAPDSQAPRLVQHHAATVAAASGRAADAAAAEEEARRISTARRLLASDSSTLLSRPQSRRERGAFAAMHAAAVEDWARWRRLRVDA